MALLLRDNPLFQQCWRGGSHASWRRWYFSPITEAAIGILLFLAAVWSLPDLRLTLGVWLMLITALASTLVAIRQMGNAMAGEWRQERMLDILLTPLDGRDLLLGLPFGEMLGWLLWLPCAALLSLALILGAELHPGDPQFLAAAQTRTDLLALWLYLIFYAVTQTLWVAGVMVSALARNRSPVNAQTDGVMMAMVIVPFAWIFTAAVQASRAGNWIQTTESFAYFLFFNPWHAGFQVGKALMGLLLIRRRGRPFQAHLARLLEQGGVRRAGEP